MKAAARRLRLTRAPWLLIVAWGVSLLAAALGVGRDANYFVGVESPLHGKYGHHLYGFFSLRGDIPDLVYRDEIEQEINTGHPDTAVLATWRRLDQAGLVYCVALGILCSVAASSPLWWRAAPALRHGLAMLAALAPLVGLLVFGRAMHHVASIYFVAVAEMAPTWSSWVAASVWFLALVATLVVIRAERRPRTSTEAAVFD